MAGVLSKLDANFERYVKPPQLSARSITRYPCTKRPVNNRQKLHLNEKVSEPLGEDCERETIIDRDRETVPATDKVGNQVIERSVDTNRSNALFQAENQAYMRFEMNRNSTSATAKLGNRADIIDGRRHDSNINNSTSSISNTTGNQADSVNRQCKSKLDNSGKSKESLSDRLGIVLCSPKYRQYATPDLRLKSYKKWPKRYKLDIDVLIHAGFAYTGVDDSVRCFYCGGAFRDWPDDADPWREHALKFPHCGHLRQCKGDAYIKHVRGEDDSDCEIDGDANDVVDRVEVAMKRNKDAVMAARDFCSDETLLRCAIRRLLLENDTFSGVDLVKETEQIKEDVELEEESAKIAQAACLENDDSSESETEDESDLGIIEEENRKLKDPVMCKICFDAIACMITLPCGHLVSCSQCISALSKCALCRAQIKGTVRALMAV